MGVQATEFGICVVDGDDVGTSEEAINVRRQFSPQRLLKASIELHTRGYNNLIIFTSHDAATHLDQFPEVDLRRIMWKQVPNYTIYDLVKCAAEYRCRLVTNID